MDDLSLKSIVEEISKGHMITIQEHNGAIFVLDYHDREMKGLRDIYTFENSYLKELMKHD